MSRHISYDPADTKRFYVSPVADPQRLVPHWACCGGRCDDTQTASCPVMTPNEPYVLGMLLGIRRELDQWNPNAEHRCWTKLDELTYRSAVVCTTCGKWSFVLGQTQRILMMLVGEYDLRDAVLEPHPRPGTTITPTSKQPELVRAEVGE